MPFILLLLLVLLQGCSGEDKPTPYKIIGGSVFEDNTSAVVAFFKNNTHKLKKLQHDQELIGYTVKCGRWFSYTEARVGSLVNSVGRNDVQKRKGCEVYSYVHTHPPQPEGLTVDFFSPSDLSLSNRLPVYMLALENGNLRVTTKDLDRKGLLLRNLYKEKN